MRNLFVVSAVLSLACVGVADAQGRGGGQGSGVGGGLGGSVSGGLGGGIGGGRTSAPPPTTRTTPAPPSQTTVRGAADVLPGTSASARGSERGSMSTAHATQTFTANTVLRDSRGATVGRILRTVTLPDGSTRVIVAMGADTVSLPSASLTMDGRYANSTMNKAQIRAMARASAG